jgi:DNA-binding response OmpR family regulator
MNPARLLLVDDERHIVDVVEHVLKEQGFEVTVAMDGDAGLKAFEQSRPDLVLLDLTLPGIPGLELFKEIRGLCPATPVIMLTSRAEEIDRILGLELGADDYVTKPFSNRELVARVKALLRRTQPGNERSEGQVLVRGPLSIDREAYTVSLSGERIDLTRAEFRLIECLARYPARVFTRDVLIDQIYDGEHVVTERSVDTYVKRLRQKVSEMKPELNPIETVHGFGYKFNQELTES